MEEHLCTDQESARLGNYSWTRRFHLITSYHCYLSNGLRDPKKIRSTTLIRHGMKVRGPETQVQYWFGTCEVHTACLPAQRRLR